MYVLNEFIGSWYISPEVDRTAAQAEPGSDYVDSNDWYETPSGSRRQPPATTPASSSPDAEAAAADVGGNRGSHLVPHEVAPSRLAASTSGFSPSVQLAATRRSTSIAPPVVTTFHKDKPSRNEGAVLHAEDQRTVSSDVPSEVLPTKPSSDAKTHEVPATKPNDRPASYVHQSDKMRSVETVERRSTGTTPTTERPQDGASLVPPTKKTLKRRARQEKRRLACRDSDPLERNSRTSLPGEGTSSVTDETPAAPPSESSVAAVPQHPTEDQPTLDDAEARPSNAASRTSCTLPLPKSVNQATLDRQTRPTEPPRPPFVATTSKAERRPEETELSPSVASTRVTPKTEAADAPPSLIAGFRSEYVRVLSAVFVVHIRIQLYGSGLLLSAV